MTTPEVQSHDKDFVYFTDGTRMSYAPHTSGMSNPLGIFPAMGRKAPKVAPEYYAATETYLRANKIS